MEKCIFCKMVNGKLKYDKVFENERLLAFRDINPQAPIHILIIPKKHIVNLHDTKDEDLLGELLKITAEIALTEGVTNTGYRVIINSGRNAGQSVEHLHLHLLGGRVMKWPPG